MTRLCEALNNFWAFCRLHPPPRPSQCQDGAQRSDVEAAAFRPLPMVHPHQGSSHDP